MTRSDTWPRLRPITLSFRDPDEEGAYIKHHFVTSIVPVRWATLAGLTVLLLFGYLDYRLFPEYCHVIWVGRGICAIYVVFGFAVTYTACYHRFMQLITALGTVLCSVLAIWMIHVTRTHVFCAYLYVGILICVIFSCMFLRLRFPWAAGSSLLMLGSFLALARPILDPDAYFVDAVYLSIGTVSSILGAYSIEVHLRQNYWQAMQLDRARLQYQSLLHSILPPAIAARLNNGEKVIADDKQVSILFADIVGSVNLATKLGSAKPLVELLNCVFAEFDQLVSRYQLEMIKTNGDGCMIAGNCSIPLSRHVHAMADLALAMKEAIGQHRGPDGHPLSLRIGIHVGPVVAGVMKLGKLSYDLWGDTVNIASRMESHGPDGAIQVTKAIRDVLDGDYLIEGPFSIEVKGKGTMLVYHLLGRARRSGETSRGYASDESLGGALGAN